MARRVQHRREPDQAEDQAEIEQDGRRRRRREPVERVEHAAQLRNQRDEQQIGKGDPGEFDGEVEFIRIGGETRREEIHRPRHGDLHRGAEDQQNHDQYRKHALAEMPGGVGAVFGQDTGEVGNEGGRERPFGEQPPEEIGQLERNEERIRHRPRAEQRGNQDVADEAENAAGQGVAADCGDRAQQSHAVSRRAARNGRRIRVRPARRPLAWPGRRSLRRRRRWRTALRATPCGSFRA